MGHIGLDEVGRGCWAGPLLVVAARMTGELPQGLKDSKLLSKKQRENLIEAIQEACDLGEGWVEAAEIDELGLSAAMKLAVERALIALKALENEEIIMDGAINYCAPRFVKVTCEPKADNKYPIVSAASIYAKVLRDKKMAELAKDHPNYGFDSHVGYGTAKHIEALKKFGICKLHRLSYKPIAQLANSDIIGT